MYRELIQLLHGSLIIRLSLPTLWLVHYLSQLVLQSLASKAVGFPHSFSIDFAFFADSLTGYRFSPFAPDQVSRYWWKAAGFLGQPCLGDTTALTNWGGGGGGGARKLDGSKSRQEGCRILCFVPKVQLILVNKSFSICFLPLVNPPHYFRLFFFIFILVSLQCLGWFLTSFCQFYVCK